MSVCVCAELTCVRDEADFEEGANHGGHVAGLVVPQGPPLGNHECVHGNTHVSIAEVRGRRKGVSIACSLPAEWGIGYLSNTLFLFTSPMASSWRVC